MCQISALKQTIGIPYYSNMTCKTLGLDSVEHCFDKTHYNSYPDVSYSFNELGFRFDLSTLTKRPILAVGDSFTLGLGVNVEHTWPSVLSRQLNLPVLNFSLNGASNDWIVRKTQDLLEFFDPLAVVVHYTFSHRRERPNIDWYDDERTECEPLYNADDNFKNWQKNFRTISALNVPAIHSFIPNWHELPVDYVALSKQVVTPVDVVDLARDGFHYGVETNQLLSQQISTSLLAVL
jgi:hypothetical protein